MLPGKLWFLDRKKVGGGACLCMCVGVWRVCVGGRLGVGSVRVCVWGVWGAGVCGWGLDACVSCVLGGDMVVCGVQRATTWRGSEGPPELQGAQLWLALNVRLPALCSL